MIYNTLGNTGLKISALSLGSWMTFGETVDDETSEACIRTAYDNGVNFFDGAEVYAKGNADATVGRILAKTGWDRGSYLLSGKCMNGGGGKPYRFGTSRQRLRDCCDTTLKRYKTDYLDLFFCHLRDESTPLEEIVLTMNHLIQQGKILYWGTSKFNRVDLLKMWEFAKTNGLEGPHVEQPPYNMIRRDAVDDNLVPLFEMYGMGSTIFSPLQGGLLSGKYNDEKPDENSRLVDPRSPQFVRDRLDEPSLRVSRKLAEVADELGCTQAQLSIAWVLKNPNVSTCILGAKRPAQVEENLKALEVVEKLTDDVMQRIEEILATL
jgi:voltage-dependent potassium channel beta subunit